MTQNKEAEAIRDLAAKVLGWDREDVDTFSLKMLREMFRDKKSGDGKKVYNAITWGFDPRNPNPIWLGEPKRQ